MYLSRCDNDFVWNYGFSKNFADGLLMYKDYNMIITPLYPTIIGILMKILGTNILTFTLLNTIIIFLIYLIIYKKYSKAFIPLLLICSFNIKANYNYLCVLLLFILIYLEENKSNDYLIGIILGLIFLTKSSFLILTLASLYYLKNFGKIVKRFLGFLIPNLIYIIYFYLNKSLFYYLNYAFGGLIDFSKRADINIIGLSFALFILFILIYLYIKRKDLKLLYIILFQIMNYPLFNCAHILYSLIPTIFYLALISSNKIDFKNKQLKKYLKIYLKILIIILLLCPLFSILLFHKINESTLGINSLKYKLVEQNYLDNANIIKDNIEALDKVYFIMYEAYYNKMLLDLKINRYDLLLKGNIGYNGEEEAIKYFDSLPSDTLFLTYNNYEQGEASEKIYNYITNNYTLIKTFANYNLYKNNNTQ
jgi:hypothetical protein